MKLFVWDKYSVVILVLILVFCAAMLPIGLSEVTPAAGGKNHVLPIYCVDTEEKKLAVTFDCAWNADDIDRLIQVLDDYQCKATFFVVGDWLEKYPEAVEKLVSHGHEIGNHSDRHGHFNSLSEEEILADIAACDEKIMAATGQEQVLFRAPYGEYNEALVRLCNSTGRHIIQWSIDSLDWKGLTAEQMQSRIFPKVENGSILLFHNGTEQTADALPSILERLAADGYTFVTVGDLIYQEGYWIDHTGKQIKKTGDS